MLKQVREDLTNKVLKVTEKCEVITQASDYSVRLDTEILPCCQVTNAISIRDQNMIILVFLGKIFIIDHLLSSL